MPKLFLGLYQKGRFAYTETANYYIKSVLVCAYISTNIIQHGVDNLDSTVQ